MSEYAFCPLCAAPLAPRVLDGHSRLTCTKCDFIYYQNPAPAAGVVLVENEQVLWVQRKFEPRKGGWTFPAGFLEWNEHIEECAVRETQEETGIEVELDGLLGVYMAMDDPRTQVVLTLYRGHRVGGELVPGDDAIDARYFPVENPPEDIAFRAHRMAYDDLLRSRR